MDTIKERVKHLATLRKVGLPKVEAELGFGNGTIVKWDKSSPSVDKLQKVADYFDVSVDYLLGREPSNETEVLLQYIQDNPEVKVLLLALMEGEKEDLEAMIYLAKRMRKSRIIDGTNLTKEDKAKERMKLMFSSFVMSEDD